MKVLHVIPAIAERYGGPSVALRGMARALVASGLDVSVATTNADGRGVLDVPLGSPVNEDGVRIHYFGRSVPGEWKYSWTLATWLARHIAEFDVVHVHALFSFSTMAGCRWSRRRRIPYVLRPLGTLGEWSLRQGSWKKRPYMALVERGHLDSASAIHVTSEAERDDIVRQGFGEKAEVIPLGLSVPLGLPRRRNAGEPLRLVYLSRIHPKKNLPSLLEAVRFARRAGVPATLAVAGSGDDGYVTEMQQLSRSLGLESAVTFLGAVHGEDKLSLLASSHAFVLPSFHENFGLAAVEAMGMGVPVILAEGVAVAADAQTANAGIVAGIEPTQLANAIAEIAGNEERRFAMGGNARDLAGSSFSWNATASHLIALYQRVARS